jgi:class 3 adenylate cyclase
MLNAAELRCVTLNKRKLTTILAADVVGFSRLVSEDEEGTIAAAWRPVAQSPTL